MNIVVATRCLNEEQFLPIFLANHPFASKIVICDGGSDDQSKAIATNDPRVIWTEFTERVPGKHSGWRNPEGAHINATIDVAEALDPDWLYLTEMDAIPSLNLQRALPEVLEATGCSLVSTWLCYVAPGCTEHYPQLMKGPGYTCWRKGLGRATNLDDPFEGQGALRINSPDEFIMNPSEGRIHLTFWTEEWVAKKAKFYEQVHGLNSEAAHPNARCGPRAAIPDWAKWNATSA